MIRLRLLGLLTAAALLVPAASASGSAPASASAAGFVVRLKAPTHHPKVGKRWRITVTAKRKGSNKPVHAAAFYQFLYGGSVVSKQYPAPHGGKANKPYHFYGHFSDTLKFPQRSVGQPLTFRVVVRAGRLGTAHADYNIRVVK